MNQYGYAGKKEAIINRLRRAEGQVRGVSRMVEQDAYCIDILTQISAAQAALDKVALQLLGEHARSCLVNDQVGPKSVEAKADELVGAIQRMLAR